MAIKSKNGTKRAPVIIVTAPGHMTGARKQIETFYATGEGKLPPWYKEWDELFGSVYHMEVLESPSQVAGFFQGAHTDIETPRVGFISNTKLSLHSGVREGVNDLLNAPWAIRHASRYQHLVEKEMKELRAKRSAASKKTTAEVVEEGGEDDKRDWSAPFAAGESARTRKRDMTFRVGRRHPLVRNGLGCPTCGRIVRNSQSQPVAIKALRSRGFAHIKCVWCGDNIGQQWRVRDSVPDRDQPVFMGFVPAETTFIRPVASEGVVLQERNIPLFDAKGQPVMIAGADHPDATALFDSRGKPVLIAGEDHPDAIMLFDVSGAPFYEWNTREKSYTTDQDGNRVQCQGVQRLGVQATTVITEKIREVTWEAKRGPAIPWGKQPRSNPRYALGELIGKRYKGMVDVYVADEVQDYKGGNTAVGNAFGAMNVASRYTIALTGTETDGKASNLYWLLLRMGNKVVQDEYGWEDESRFVLENGVTAEVTRTVTRKNEAGVYSGNSTTSTDTEELPGATAPIGTTLQNFSIQVLLRHMGFNLPGWSEDATIAPMPADIYAAYKYLEGEGGKLVRKNPDALGSYLQATLSYPFQPWTPKSIGSKKANVSIQTEVMSRDLILPHHTVLAEFAASRVKDGRRVLVYGEHTMKDDLLADVGEKITKLAADDHGVTLKVAILRSNTVKPGERSAWFAKKEEEGYNVVLCNPRLVKTGLNLIGWPSIFVLEPCYSLYVLAQAIKRGYRPTQTMDCEVHYFAYSQSMSERALGIAAEKLAALAILRGDSVGGGVAVAGRGASLMQELARIVLAGEDSDMNSDVVAALKVGARAFTDQVSTGAAELLGVDLSKIALVPQTEVLALANEDVILSNAVAAPKPMFGSSSLLELLRGKKAKQKKAAPATPAGQLSMFGTPSATTTTGQSSVF